LQLLDDTIVAISTPAGTSRAAIVRLSGPQSFPILESLVAEPSCRLAALPPYSAREAALRLRAPGPRIPASLYLMRAPRSYTRQDVAEIHTLGSPPLLRMLLDALVERGARIAEPGEFTRRAFLGGRIDLAQAEAVLAVVQAASASELRAAARALQGHPSRHIGELHDTLVGLRAQVEASIDFAEHDIELITQQDLLAAIDEALAVVNDELKNADAGTLPPEGVRVALCGLPNAGKSSLFNALLARDRAIVTEIPGTTRDAVAEPLTLEGIRFRLYDTAGITPPPAYPGPPESFSFPPSADRRLPSPPSDHASRVTRHPSRVTRHGPPISPPAGSESCGRVGTPASLHAIEADAIARSLGLIAGTHIALVVLDASQPLGDAERQLWAELPAPHKILVLSKSDLPSAISDDEALCLVGGASGLREQRSPTPRAERAPPGVCPPPTPSEGEGGELVVRTSALTGQGLGPLKEMLAHLVRAGRVDASPADLTWNARQRQALQGARQALRRARTAAADDLGAEFVAADLRETHDALAAITGQTVAEDILDVIFAQFCIGK